MGRHRLHAEAIWWEPVLDGEPGDLDTCVVEWVVKARGYLGEPGVCTLAVVVPLARTGWRYEVDLQVSPPRGWARRGQPTLPGQLQAIGRQLVSTGLPGVLAYLDGVFRRLAAAQAAAALYPDPRL